MIHSNTSVSDVESDAVSCLDILANAAMLESSQSESLVSTQVSTAAKNARPSTCEATMAPLSPPLSNLSLVESASSYDLLHHSLTELRSSHNTHSFFPNNHMSSKAIRTFNTKSSDHSSSSINKLSTDLASFESSQAQQHHPNQQIFLSPPTPGSIRATRYQVKVLSAIYAENPMPSGAMHEAIGARIGMSKKAVRNWFQNNRSKARRSQEQLDSENSSRQILSDGKVQSNYEGGRNVMSISSLI
ncbi:hypothetical protein BDR26DRAFT_1004323 [Obelidium mucronatum]|nr:hypothetical protein BDR26DRAFT_1004323 [Obelidium mucronatum]